MITLFGKKLFTSIIRHNIGYLAAVMSYFAFTSMVPLGIFLIYGTSLFIRSTDIEWFFDQLLQSYVPLMPYGGTVLATTVHRLTTIRPLIGLMGVAGLLWGSLGGFISLQQTLDTLCEVRHRRSFIKQYIAGFSMLGLLLALALASLIVTSLSPQFLALLGHRNVAVWGPLMHHLSHVLFAVILFITCYCIYRFMPSRVVSNPPLLCGAAVATGGVYVSRELFVVYTHHLGNYELIYGALTYIMLLSFWVYIASVVFLLGMEVALVMDIYRLGK